MRGPLGGLAAELDWQFFGWAPCGAAGTGMAPRPVRTEAEVPRQQGRAEPTLWLAAPSLRWRTPCLEKIPAGSPPNKRMQPTARHSKEDLN
jgi:hypothetical protein